MYLIKGLNLYQIKNDELNALLFKTIDQNIEKFSVKQLEILLWSLSRRHLAHHQEARANHQINDMPEYQRYATNKLIEKIKQKAPSMRPRGIAFAIEAMTNLNFVDE